MAATIFMIAGLSVVPLSGQARGSGSAATAPSDGPIAFDNSTGGPLEVFDVYPGGAVNSLTSNSGVTANADNTDPAWSPDWSQLAFVSSGHILVANAGGITDLTPNDSAEVSNADPTWTPDGTSIVFDRINQADVDPQYDIYKMSATDGSGLTDLTSTPGSDETEPTVNPSTGAIAYMRDGEVWTMTSSGGSQTHLTSIDADNPDQPAWSPDGQTLAFQGNQADIWLYDASSDQATQLTADDATIFAAEPAWSPDGTKLAVQGSDRPDRTTYALYEVDATTGGETMVANTNTGVPEHPSWASLGQDTTTPPTVTPHKGTVPPGAVGRKLVITKRVTATERHLIVKRRKTYVELHCGAATGRFCKLHGVLRRGAKRIGTLSGHIPGQRIGTLPIKLGSGVTLTGGAIHARLQLTGTAGGAGRVKKSTPIILTKKHGVPPVVESEPVSDVTGAVVTGSGSPATARIAGAVEPAGSATTYHLEYGYVAGVYQAATTNKTLPGDRLMHFVSGVLTGLQSNTTYHYRVVANNAGGITNGPDSVFTTPKIITPYVVPLVPDVTTAGMVSLVVDSSCTLFGPPQALQVSCTATALNPQPGVSDFPPRTVPAAIETLAAIAPAGTVAEGTGGTEQPMQVVVPPDQSVVLPPVYFAVSHLPTSGAEFRIDVPNASPAVSLVAPPALAPPASHVLCHTSTGSTAKVAPGDSVACDITTVASSSAQADLDDLTLTQSGEVEDETWKVGKPPAALAPSEVATMTVRYTVPPSAPDGSTAELKVDQLGHYDLDGSIYEVHATSNQLTVSR